LTSRHWQEGSSFLFRGEEVCLRLCRGSDLALHFGDQVIQLKSEAPDYRPIVEMHLRRVATRELPLRTHELAVNFGITIGRVSVRAQRSRWGSCSARGTISLNWRLIHAPPHVVDYLIIHELMHRREMNHSARYWKHVAAACPGHREAEAWLKKTRLY
jgi:predicted metal-dependent hydrolase